MVKWACFLLTFSSLCSHAIEALAQFYHPVTGNYYLPIEVPDGLSWTEAVSAAADTSVLGISGRLATINSQVENDYLANLSLVDRSWIGAYQSAESEEPDGGWRWITDEPWDFTRWKVGEPDNSGGNANALQLSADDGFWTDEESSQTLTGYIIEYSSHLRGDFDGNRFVDSTDLSIWQQTYSSNDFLAADASSNGIIDGRDFLVWQRNFSAGRPQPTYHNMAELRSQARGSLVTVVGVISNTVDLINNPSSKNFFLQDELGGVSVFGSDFEIDQLLQGASAGDKVVVSGVLGSFSGALQILPISTTRLTVIANPGVPVPIEITMSDLADMSASAEVYENMLVRLSNVQFTESGSFAGLTNYTVSDSTATAVVRVSTTTQDLVGQPIPVGAVDLVGQLVQFDGSNPGPGVPGVGYQLYLRSLTDITPSASIQGASVPETRSLTLLGTTFLLTILRRQTWNSCVPDVDRALCGM